MEMKIPMQEEKLECPICVLVGESDRERFGEPVQKVLSKMLGMEVPLCIAKNPVEEEQQISRVIVVPFSRMALREFSTYMTMELARKRGYPIVAVMQEPELEGLFRQEFPDVPFVPYYDRPGEKSPARQLLDLLRQIPEAQVPETARAPEDASRDRLARRIESWQLHIDLCERFLTNELNAPADTWSAELWREIFVARMVLDDGYRTQKNWDKCYVNLLEAYSIVTNPCQEPDLQGRYALKAICLRRLGDLCRIMGETEDAGRWYNLLKEGGAGERDCYEKQMVFRLYVDFGREMEERGDFEKAVALYGKARAVVEPLGQAEEELDWFRRYGDLLTEMGDSAKAMNLARLLHIRLIDEPARNEVKDRWAIYGMKTQRVRARVWCDKSYRNRLQAVEEDPSPQNIWNLGTSCLTKGKTERVLGNEPEGPWFKRAMELYEKSGRTDLTIWDRRNLAEAMAERCVYHYIEHEKDQHNALSLRLVEHCRALFSETGERQDKEFLVRALGIYSHAGGGYAETMEAEQLCRELMERYPSVDRYQRLWYQVCWTDPI